MSNTVQAPLSVEYALLGFVRHEPLHGYEIYHRLSNTPELRLIWRMKQSRLYALLSRLADEGLMRATIEPQEGRPSRKVFHLTPKGKEAFQLWLTRPVQLPREMRLEFMLKLYFAYEEGPEVVASLVQQQMELGNQWLTAWGGESETASSFIQAVRRYRRANIKAIQDWLASLLVDFIPIEQADL